ncbi:hypothetical protein DXG03_001674 [Asterophora parasitica]|uniref:Cytochrome P450 n=1 Tax=Asterophora parasitica TaxID=117018 RepID=A0A9P7KGL0_9AGAR|nr:hypothetical protein DXG03_001674 [Asterophora parasitica]
MFHGFFHILILFFATTSRFAFLTLFVVPLLVILLNALWQVLAPRKASDPPSVFHWLPFVGSALSYGDDPVKFFIACREKYGDVFAFTLFGRRITATLGAKGNNFVLGGKFTVFNAEDAYAVFMEQKRFAKVGLIHDNFRAYLGMIEEEIDDYLKNDPVLHVYQLNDTKRWRWSSFDVCKVLQEITILTASRTLQSKEVREGLDKTFSTLFNDLDGGFTPISFLLPNLPLPNFRRRDNAQAKMSKFYTDIIRKRRERGTVDEPDMGEALMQQSYRNGEKLRDHEIAHLMNTLLIAGRHTSASSGAWAMLHLAANTDIADALYEEQVKHFGTPDGKSRPMTYEELRALPLLDSVIRETLRMHPPIHSIMRGVRDDVAIPATLGAPSEDITYVVPKGHWVLASPLISQTDPDVWKDPLMWDPYRWNDPKGVAAQAFATYTDNMGEKIDYGFGAVSKGTESPYQPFGADAYLNAKDAQEYSVQAKAVITALSEHTAPVLVYHE